MAATVVVSGRYRTKNKPNKSVCTATHHGRQKEVMITTWRCRLYKQINGLTVYPQDILLLTRQVMGITIYWELQVTEP